ncbi:hypothetical protein FOE78_15565 [Microlunatus elymi]|uniref:Uncharacterized protein n=1 Tax=Microlunatus elymi TaxID=2596828 RepID=A0A516Q139_9ACTN|nr:hypothetical protein [Microlunatus elymi]QDP97155.1 hypothetical protein FOE78_15565 [Microlunatus elymi]
MSATTIETSAVRSSVDRPTRARRPRPSRGSGRAGRPATRSVTGLDAPSLRRSPAGSAEVRGCSTAPVRRTAVAAGSAGWRLTSRGIAVVLITGAVLVAAAITVITATAITVTSDNYIPSQSALGNR